MSKFSEILERRCLRKLIGIEGLLGQEEFLRRHDYDRVINLIGNVQI